MQEIPKVTCTLPTKQYGCDFATAPCLHCGFQCPQGEALEMERRVYTVRLLAATLNARSRNDHERAERLERALADLDASRVDPG